MQKKKEYLVVAIGLLFGCFLCMACDNNVMDIAEGRPVIQMVELLTRYKRINAIIANVVLFILGYVVVENCMENKTRWLKWTLAFPVGTFVWTCLSIICLLLGIPYSKEVMGIVLVLITGILTYRLIKHGVDVELFLRGSAFFLMLTIILSSGILWNIIGNDTTFFNENYGYWLVTEKGFVNGLVVPVLSTGLSVATLCSFFTMFGVDNMYLAQNIFRCLFIVFFYKALENTCESTIRKKLALLGTVVLITSPAYSILSSWMISNSFMMFEMFMLVFFLMKLGDNEKEYLLPAMLVMFIISFTRVEGIIIALYIIICAAPLNISKKVLNILIIPSIAAQIIYQIWCMKINQNVLTEIFISTTSIIILIAFMGIVFLFVQIKNKSIFQQMIHMWGSIVIVVGMLGTIGLCVLDYEKYLYNLKITLQNILYLGKTGSWGLTPLLIVIGVMWIAITGYFDHFIDTLWIGYFILILAVCWSRESVLRISIADSGNRILIQIVPILIFSLVLRADKVCKECDVNTERKVREDTGAWTEEKE